MAAPQLKWQPEVMDESQDHADLSDGERLLVHIWHEKPCEIPPGISWWNIHDATKHKCPWIASARTQAEAREKAEKYAQERMPVRGLAKTA